MGKGMIRTSLPEVVEEASRRMDTATMTPRMAATAHVGVWYSGGSSTVADALPPAGAASGLDPGPNKLVFLADAEHLAFLVDAAPLVSGSPQPPPPPQLPPRSTFWIHAS
jgi:hypothetical protein